MNYGYPQQAYYPQQQKPNYAVSNPVGLKGRPVTSLEEARASIVDFDGSIFFFPDLANRRIYTKQITMDGTALINVYELKEIPVQQEQTVPDLSNFVTKDEFKQAITQLREGLAAQSQNTVAQKPALELNF